MTAAAGNKDHQKVILVGDGAVGSSYAYQSFQIIVLTL